MTPEAKFRESEMQFESMGTEPDKFKDRSCTLLFK
jgi:hypothetical protein